MTPATLLAACTQVGVLLKWDGSHIKACGDARAVSQLLPMLKTHKAALQDYFEEEQRDYYEERAAIAEYDGGLSREEAEAQARMELPAWKTNRTYH